MTEEFVQIDRKCYDIENPTGCAVPNRPAPYSELYDIQGVIGIGGGGTVYSGTRIADGRQVALKCIREDMVNKWGELDGCCVPVEFLYLHILSKSPGVIQMLDWFTEKGEYILVMESIPRAMDLDDLLGDHGPFEEDVCRHIVRQVTNAILQCHENEIVHRDIKVENVLINPLTREVKVIDFGCGTRLKNIPELRLSGTPIFYPPEWYTENCYYGDRLDVWCLGVLLYMLVENRVPFSDKDDIVKCKIHHSRGKVFSKSYRKFIKSLLQKDQERRPSIKNVLAHPWLHADSDESEAKKKKSLFTMFRKFFKR